MLNFKRKYMDSVIHTVLFCAVAVSILVTVFVVFMLTIECFSFFSEVNIFDFLFGTTWEPLLEPKSFGVLPLVSGTMLIVVGSTIIAVPTGIIIALYLSEYSSKKTRSIIKPMLEILAGIPTVVYGYFALTFITPIIKYFFPEVKIFNALSGAIVVGIMILPMVSSLCEDAFYDVSKGLKEGAYALGATQYEVALQVMLPSAYSRIGAATVLAVSRAIGETMAVTLAAGATPTLTMNPFDSIQTMTAYIVQVSLGDTPAGGIEYQTSFAVAGLLFVMTFFLNSVGKTMLLKLQR